MTKLLLLAICAFVVWKLFAGDKRYKQTKEKENKEQLIASGELVRDPVCGAYVSKDSGIRVRQGDVVYNFCSYECRDKFVKRLQGAQAPQQVPQHDAADAAPGSAGQGQGGQQQG